MIKSNYSYRTPGSKLVEIAKIARPYKGRPDMLNQVATEVKQIVPVLSLDAAKVIAREMGISLSQVYNFITFYAMLSTKPHGKFTVRICKSAPCHVNGASEVIHAIQNQLGIKMGETTEDGRFTLEYCPCLGLCDIAPAIMINNEVYGNLTAETAKDVIKMYIRGGMDA